VTKKDRVARAHGQAGTEAHLGDSEYKTVEAVSEAQGNKSGGTMS